MFSQVSVCLHGSLCTGGVSVQEGFLSWVVSVEGTSVQRVSVQGSLCDPCTVKNGWYATYWNAFLSLNHRDLS